MDLLVKLVFNLLLITYLPCFIFIEADICVKTGPCTCKFPNGTGIDLTPSSKAEFFTAQIYSENKAATQFRLTTYYYHPCYDTLPPAPVNKDGLNNTCNKALSICRHVLTLDQDSVVNKTFKMDEGVNNYLGSTNESTFSDNGDSIIYNNLPSDTIVLLVCAEFDDKLHINSLADPNDIVLAFYSRNACLKKLGEPTDTGRSVGSTLVIIFFSFVIFYLVLGICTKKFLMGATGIEVIPNLAFWSDLPNLVKDGWAFMLNGFKLPARGTGPAVSPDPNSYDSI